MGYPSSRRGARANAHVRLEYAGERTAATDVSVELAERDVARRLRVLLVQGDRRHYESGRAEAAHERVFLAEGLLHGMQSRPLRETVHGPDLLTLDVDRERRAGIHRAAV